MKHCTTDKCPQILDSSCVFYEGASLIFSGINTNDSVEVVIQKLNLKLESIPRINLDNYYNKQDINNFLSYKADISSLSQVAFSGDYLDLNNKPSIPTKTSDLENDSEFITIDEVDDIISDISVVDVSNYYTKTETFSQTQINNLLNNKQNNLGYTPENVANKSDSYTASSSTNYASTKALVDGLATKLDKGAYTGTAQDLKNSIDGKLNKPTTTSNTTSYPYVVGEDGNGNSARLPAGDLGKNFFNSDLSNTTARNHTMNAGITVNTLGNPHTLAGLPNKNTDIANFRKVRVQNTGGLDAVLDSKDLLRDSVASMNDAEKLNLTTSLNGGYSSATMSVGAILPINVSNFFNELTYVTLIGNNLNLNPSNFSVKILDINNNVVADVSSQSSVNNVTSLTFWFNFYNFPTGIYKIRLTNGAATLTTTTTFEVNNQNTSKNEIDTSTLTWLEASNVGAPFTNNYQKGTTSAGIVISANAGGEVIGNSILKSSPIINTADYDNFYLTIEGNANYNSTILVSSSNIAQIGIVKNPTNVVDVNESINLGVQVSGGGNSGMNTNSFGGFPSIGVNTKPSYFKLYIIKRQNSITYILQIGNAVSTIVENILTDFKIGLILKGTPFSIGSGSVNSFYITNISGYTF